MCVSTCASTLFFRSLYLSVYSVSTSYLPVLHAFGSGQADVSGCVCRLPLRFNERHMTVPPSCSEGPMRRAAALNSNWTEGRCAVLRQGREPPLPVEVFPVSAFSGKFAVGVSWFSGAPNLRLLGRCCGCIQGFSTAKPPTPPLPRRRRAAHPVVQGLRMRFGASEDDVFRLGLSAKETVPCALRVQQYMDVMDRRMSLFFFAFSDLSFLSTPPFVCRPLRVRVSATTEVRSQGFPGAVG